MSCHSQVTKKKKFTAPLLLPNSLAAILLRLYDLPHPTRPGTIIRGYDKQHAIRTARMCAAVALRLNHKLDLVKKFQIACILHDLGRTGLDRKLFGRIWSWARKNSIPTRPQEWRAAFPNTRYGQETESFLKHYKKDLEAAGIEIDSWAREQIEMRLGFARRMTRRLREVKPELESYDIRWMPWMTRVTLYYYYPEKLNGDAPWIKQLGETLVACEQFEAHNNRQRGQDYYCREGETIYEALNYLETLRNRGIVSTSVIKALVSLAAEGEFDELITHARGIPITRKERLFLKKVVAQEV